MKFHHWLVKTFWLAIGVFVAINAHQLGLGKLSSPGPGFIFFFAASFIIFLAAIDLVIAYVGKPKTNNKIDSMWIGVHWQRILLVLAVLLIYIYFFYIWGFTLPTFFLMVFLFKMLEPTKWWFAITSSIITVIIFYSLFKIWLAVPFPKDIIGF